MAGNSEFWVQCFTCCLTQQRTTRSRSGRSQQHQRLRIDRSMIGVPTNFRHTAHISSGDVDMSIAQLANLQAQMQRKGGYDTNIGAKVRTSRAPFFSFMTSVVAHSSSHFALFLLPLNLTYITYFDSSTESMTFYHCRVALLKQVVRDTMQKNGST